MVRLWLVNEDLFRQKRRSLFSIALSVRKNLILYRSPSLKLKFQRVEKLNNTNSKPEYLLIRCSGYASMPLIFLSGQVENKRWRRGIGMRALNFSFKY